MLPCEPQYYNSDALPPDTEVAKGALLFTVLFIVHSSCVLHYPPLPFVPTPVFVLRDMPTVITIRGMWPNRCKFAWYESIRHVISPPGMKYKSRYSSTGERRKNDQKTT